MSIIRKGSMAIGRSSGALIFDLGALDRPRSEYANTATPATTVPPDPTQTTLVDVANWGTDNLLPKLMVDEMEATGILSGTVDHKVRFALGNQGPQPYRLLSRNPDGSEELEAITDPAIDEWLLENDIYHHAFGLFKDLSGLGQNCALLKFNRAGTAIGLMWRHDVSEMRYQKKDDSGHIKNIYLSSKWLDGINTLSYKSGDLLQRRLLPSIAPISFLRAMKPEALRGTEFAYVTRQPGWNRPYYSMPLWYSARKWVSIAKQVPEMKAAIFENNIRLKYKVVIYDEYWLHNFPDWDTYDDAKKRSEQDKVYDDINDFLAGSQNAYKSIFVDGKIHPQLGSNGDRFQFIDIEPIKDETKAGELLPDSAAANFEILFSMGMSPALLGLNSISGGYAGGAGSGSDIREAALVQVMIQAFERQSLSRLLGIISAVNGWTSRHPGLVWRFPGLVLTTLDTGGSTQSTMNPQPGQNTA